MACLGNRKMICLVSNRHRANQEEYSEGRKGRREKESITSVKIELF
jgi:hypothetical protein